MSVNVDNIGLHLPALLEVLTKYCLLLDQTTAQTVVNGNPSFSEGITIFKDKPFYFDGE